MPKTTVVAIITQPQSNPPRILLTRRNIDPFSGLWCLPGGHIEANESARDAVVREVAEETGLHFDAHFWSYHDEIIPERDIHAVVLVFEGAGTGTPQAEAQEVSEMAWMTIEEARALPLAFLHNAILDTYVETGRPSDSV
jgi:8-oxo-dGTP diphosphatase